MDVYAKSKATESRYTSTNFLRKTSIFHGEM